MWYTSSGGKCKYCAHNNQWKQSRLLKTNQPPFAEFIFNKSP